MTPEEKKKQRDLGIVPQVSSEAIAARAAERVLADTSINTAAARGQRQQPSPVGAAEASGWAERAKQEAIYNSKISAMSDQVKAAQAAYDEARKDDELRQKRERALGVISGLGDTLSGIANFIGVSKGGSNQALRPASPALAEKLSAEQKERQARLQSSSAGIDRLRKDLEDLKLAKEIGMAEFDRQQAEQKRALIEKENSARVASEQRAYERALEAEKLAVQKYSAETDRARAVASGEADAFNAQTRRIEAQNKATQAKTEAERKAAKDKEAKDKEDAYVKANGKRMPYTYYKNGVPQIIEIGENLFKNLAEKEYERTRDYVAQQAGFEDYDDYLVWQDETENGNMREKKQRRKGLYKDVNTRYKKILEDMEFMEDKADAVRLYGSEAPTFIEQLELAVAAEEGNTLMPQASGVRGTGSVFDEFE